MYILGNYSELCYLNLTEELNKGAHAYRLTADLDESLSTTTDSVFWFNIIWVPFWMIILVLQKRSKPNK